MTIKKLSLISLATAAVLAVSSAAAYASTGYAAVAKTDLHVRDNAYGHVVDTLYEGEIVNVVTCDYGWCYITHIGPDGWVSARYLGFSYPYDDDDYYYGHDYHYGHDYYLDYDFNGGDLDLKFGIFSKHGGMSFGFDLSD